MLNNIRAKGPLVFKSDIGQYNVMKKNLQLWYFSARLVNGATEYTLPDFDFPTDPKDIEKLELIDMSGDTRLEIPIDVFNATKQKDGTYKLPIVEWEKQYSKNSVRL